MNFFRVIMLVVVLASAGCETSRRYTKFRVTNYRGELVADWIAEGNYRKVDNGFRIKAIERTSGPPHSLTTRYPNGWNTHIEGPHIVYWQCGKPWWLYQLDGF
jgi:hypothetical protein